MKESITNNNMFEKSRMDIGDPKTPEQPKKNQTSKEQEKRKKVERFFGFLEKIDKATDKYVGETMPKKVEKGLKDWKGFKAFNK